MRKRYASQLSTCALHQWPAEPTVDGAIVDWPLHGGVPHRAQGRGGHSYTPSGVPGIAWNAVRDSGMRLVVRGHVDDIIDL